MNLVGVALLVFLAAAAAPAKAGETFHKNLNILDSNKTFSDYEIVEPTSLTNEDFKYVYFVSDTEVIILKTIQTNISIFQTSNFVVFLRIMLNICSKIFIKCIQVIEILISNNSFNGSIFAYLSWKKQSQNRFKSTFQPIQNLFQVLN